jgi:hypothetical protein
MRHGLLGSIAVLAASAGLAFAQTPMHGSGFDSSAPGRAVAVPASFGAEPIASAPSSLSAPPADGAFYSAMQPQAPLADGGGQGGQGGGSGLVTAQLDYLLWWIQPMPSSFPLVTASTTGPRGSLGPTTSVVFGGHPFEINPFSGGRFTIDVWKPNNPRWGAEFSGTVLQQQWTSFNAGFGTEMIARPVIDANTGVPSSLTVAAPGLATGSLDILASTRLWGFETNAKYRFWCDERWDLSVLYGFRYMDLSERLNIGQRTMFVPGTLTFFYGVEFANPFEIDVNDSFQTRNQYYMSQLGVAGSWHYRRWLVDFKAKFAVGPVHETVVIAGNSTLFPTAGSAPNTVPGGLLALSSNIGRFHKDPWAFMPEDSIQIGYRFGNCTYLTLGYQFAWISRAMRAGNQVDPFISPNLLPTSAFFGAPGGVARPAAVRHEDDWWVQGLNLGLQIHY